jgi:hypothetical protein
MSDFADVEQFARQHTACGGLTPTAQSRPGAGGGYLLTITCACGATHDRWVTAEEASRPLPRPAPAPAAEPAPAVATAVAAPPTPSTWPSRPPLPRPQRVEVSLQPARRASRGRAVWLVLLLVAVGAGAAAYLTGVPLPGLSEPPAVMPRAPAITSPVVTPPPPVPPRPALDDIVSSLRQLQADTTPSISLNDYASRVAATRLAVEKLAAAAPESVRTRTREVLDLHRLAVGAWRARTVEDRDEWARVGQDPAIDLCPAVKRAVDAVSPTSAAARARVRGVAVAASLLPLWECAAEKVAALERHPAGG